MQPRSGWAFGTLVAMACIGSVLVAAMTVACLRHHAHRLAAKKLGLGPEGGCFSHQEYQVSRTHCQISITEINEKIINMYN